MKLPSVYNSNSGNLSVIILLISVVIIYEERINIAPMKIIFRGLIILNMMLLIANWVISANIVAKSIVFASPKKTTHKTNMRIIVIRVSVNILFIFSDI